MTRRLKDVDTGVQMLRVKFALQAGLPLLFITLMVLVDVLHMSLLAAMATGVVVSGAASWCGWQLLLRFGDATHELLMPSGVPAVRSYGEQEAAIAAGRYAEAADLYRAIASEEPDNIEVRLRLATLLGDQCNDLRGAKAAFLEARSLPLTDRQESVVTESLINLYQKSGDRDGLKAELARLVRGNQGTPAGASASRYLRELEAEG